MEYRVPPDVLHYDVRLIFGLSAQEIVVIGMVIIAGIQVLGLVGGLAAGLGAFVALKRYERLGRRSLAVYAALWAWHTLWRPKEVLMPRVLPQEEAGVRLTIEDAEGWRVEVGEG